MTTRLDANKLPAAQINALFEHLLELDQARLAHANGLLVRLQQHPDFTDALVDLVNAWSTAGNAIGAASDAEIQRIVSGRPPDQPLN